MNRRDAEHAASVGATLGEGPVWIAADQALWFVDIKQQRVHRFDPATAAMKAWAAPDQIGWVLPAQGGGFLAGLANGLHRFSPESGSFDMLVVVESDLPGNRLNDAAVDPSGRLWFGSMDNGETEATGRVYSWSGGTLRDSGIAPVTITNGPAIAPDGGMLYAVDTLGRSIDAFVPTPDGSLSERRRFLTFDADDGHPDGAIADAEGGVWVAFYGGGAARRYTPDGVQTDEVRFPVTNITKIALGGADGRTAYATTASKGLDPPARAQQPLAGDLFTFRVDVPGVPTPLIRLE